MDIVKLVLDTRVPIARALNALCIDSDPNERQSLRKRAYKELNAPISTDHGHLFCKLNVTNDLGESYALSCINPMALLVAGSRVCHGLFLMLATLMEQTHGEPLRCTVYHDGVTPGNNLRPDHGRKFESFLWSVLELPPWVKSRGRFRWFTFLYLTKEEMNTNRIHVHHVFKAILLMLFGANDDFNFATTGIRLRHETKQAIFRMKYDCSPQDFEAHAVLWGLKGAGALMPCPKCDNCIGVCRKYFSDDSGFAHIYDADYTKFKLRGNDEWKAIVDEIKQAVSDGRNIEELEKSAGITYSPDGILFDPWAWEQINFPSCIYMDIAHCLLGSGSVAQLSLNQFVVALVQKTQLELTDLDEFLGLVRLPLDLSLSTSSHNESFLDGEPT